MTTLSFLFLFHPTLYEKLVSIIQVFCIEFSVAVIIYHNQIRLKKGFILAYGSRISGVHKDGEGMIAEDRNMVTYFLQQSSAS